MVVMRSSTRGGPGGQARGGQNLIELALLMPLLALLLLGASDLARVYIYQTRLTDAGMAGAVYGSHFPDKTSTITSRAYAAANGQLGTPGTDFTIDSTNGILCYQGQTITLIASPTPGDCTAKTNNVLIVGPGDTIEITARYAFKPITGQIIKLLGSSYTIKARVRMVII
jgi:Flp pilus assembly protein TadG